jgi:trans-aconitate 2-methyltransferase
MSDWDAEIYHKLSDPQFAWGQGVIARLKPKAGERILDLGCGSGRLTETLAASMRLGHIVGLDRSPTMIAEAAARLAQRQPVGLHLVRYPGTAVNLVRGDGAHLPFVDAFDAVFSAATFHWILDHDRLFSSIYRGLAPGGRLVAQCGGGPNLTVLLERAEQLMRQPRYSKWFEGWSDPWYFADVPSTIARLERAGFTMVDVSLTAAPTPLANAEAYKGFLSVVCVRHHIARLPEPQRTDFTDALARAASADDPPFTLDYWRLNISASKPVGAERAA